MYWAKGSQFWQSGWPTYFSGICLALGDQTLKPNASIDWPAQDVGMQINGLKSAREVAKRLKTKSEIGADIFVHSDWSLNDLSESSAHPQLFRGLHTP